MVTLLTQGLVVGLLMGGLYGLFAVGLSLILGVAGIMHLVHGDLLMIAMYLTLGFTLMTGADPYVAIPAIVVAMILLAIFTYRVAPSVQKIVHIPQMNQMLFMLGFQYLLQNIVLVFIGANEFTLKSQLVNFDLYLGSVYISGTRLIAGIVSVVLTLALMLFLTKSDLGRSIRAATQDRDAAEAYGINVNFTYLITWIIGLGLLGFAGPMLTTIYSFYPTLGNNWLMLGIMCVVLGGLGNVMGALIGGLIMGVAFEMGQIFLPGSSGPLLPFTIFIIVLLFRPQGIFGEATRGAR